MLSAWQHRSRHLSATNTLVSACGILSLPLVVSNQSICQRTEYQSDTATSSSQSVENQRFKLKVRGNWRKRLSERTRTNI